MTGTGMKKLVGLLVVLGIAVPAGPAWAAFTRTRANTGNSISAAGDITRPAVGAATVAATSGGMPGHITQGQSYFAYANVTDGGSGMSTVTADLSPITSGQTAAAYGTAGGPFSYRGTSYTYRTASQTAGASLSQCRYTYPVVSTDAAGNVSRTDQQAMVDRQIGAAGTYYTRIDGAAAGDDLGDDQGTATAGDVNGDGRPDLLLGADYATYSGRSGSGAAYVVFGQASAGTVDLASLGTKGYVIGGAAAGDQAGISVGDAGDVNGDGIPDALVGANWADNNGRSGSGSVYVVFGKSSTTAVDLNALGGGGFRIDGAASNDDLGFKVAPAGDLNGDGRADLLAVAENASTQGRTNNGADYVVFGKATTTTVDLASLGAQGYRIDGPSGANLAWGRNAGDLNGDGIPDAIVGGDYYSYNGRTNAGSAWVVFGKASTTTVDLASLGSGGFRIDGQSAGDNFSSDVDGGRDINGDGKADLVIGAQGAGYNGRAGSGSAYVIFGKATTTTIDTASLGTQGYRIDGAVAGDQFGWETATIPDTNGDGVPDLLLTADLASNNGLTDSGAAYIVFGKSSTSTIDLNNLGTAGYRLDGNVANIAFGEGAAYSTGAGSDFDADGRSDFVVDAAYADNNGRTNSGSVYVISAPACSYKQTVLATAGVQSYWRLDETSGTSAADSKGSVTGTYTSGYTLNQSGAMSSGNPAVGATGSGTVVGFGDNYDFTGTTAYSVEAWIKPSAFTLDGSVRDIVGKDGGADGWGLHVLPAQGVAAGTANYRQVEFTRKVAGVTYSIKSAAITTGVWYHLVGTYDGTTMTLYLNGASVATGTPGNSLANTTQALFIGSGTDTATVDEVAVYNTALSAADVLRHYAMR